MTDTAHTETWTWHNQCCLALLDMAEDDRPNRWTCDACGADWRYDISIGKHTPGHGPYWQHELARDTKNAIGQIAHTLDRMSKDTGRAQQYAIVKEPTLTRWQHLKAALRP